MATRMTSEFAAPSGVVAAYFGGPGGSTTRYYWIQAIYPTGKSNLQSSNALASTLAALDQNNRVLISWNQMAGAIGYNVYYTTSSTAPIAGAILVGVTTYPTFSDSGQSNSANLQTAQFSPDGLRQFRARYDFSVDGGGAPGLITLAVSDTIPSGFVILGGYVYCITAASTGSSPTIAIGTSAGSAANALKAATASSSFSTAALVALVPVWTAATAVVMSADGSITMTTATAALTAGVFDIVLFGYQLA
jgi:hypothetical protein